MRDSARSGFTTFDLFALIVALLLLLGFLLPLADRGRNLANRSRCATILQNIGCALQMYANNEGRNGNSFPRTRYVAEAPLIGTDAGSATPSPGFDQPNSFAKSGLPSPVGDNNVMASFFLLFKTQDLNPAIFVCPGSGATHDSSLDGHSCWHAPANLYLSYSMQVPFPSPPATASGFEWDQSIARDFAVAADINPGTPEILAITPGSPRDQMSTANSLNHRGAGQNVLYGDCHVDWQPTPFAGSYRGTGTMSQRDNIYAFGSGTGPFGIVGKPQDAQDSILLPVVGTSSPTPSLSQLEPLAVVVTATGIVGAIAAAIILRRRKVRTE